MTDISYCGYFATGGALYLPIHDVEGSMQIISCDDTLHLMKLLVYKKTQKRLHFRQAMDRDLDVNERYVQYMCIYREGYREKRRL